MIDDRHSPNSERAVLYELRLNRVHYMLIQIYNMSQLKKFAEGK